MPTVNCNKSNTRQNNQTWNEQVAPKYRYNERVFGSSSKTFSIYIGSDREFSCETSGAPERGSPRLPNSIRDGRLIFFIQAVADFFHTQLFKQVTGLPVCWNCEESVPFGIFCSIWKRIVKRLVTRYPDVVVHLHLTVSLQFLNYSYNIYTYLYTFFNWQ